MRYKLTIALVVATFALAACPVFAADMPAYGSKNFSTPGDAPSYFANETLPPSARVANQATFTELDEPIASELAPVERGRSGKRASSRKSTKSASAKSKSQGRSVQYLKASSSKSTRPVSGAGSRGASATKAPVKSRTPAPASKANAAKPAKSSIGHNAAATLPQTVTTSFT